MGKNLTVQKRGKGSPVYKRSSFSYKGEARMGKNGTAVVEGFISCKAHSAPLAVARYDDNNTSLLIAPEGMRNGQLITIGGSDLKPGNICELKNIPEGTAVFNIERVPGDGGKFVRASGISAKVIARTQTKVTIQLPSKKSKDFNPNCRACIGVVAGGGFRIHPPDKKKGGGRPEKPFYKAGRKFYAMKAKGIYWPSVSGNSMNAVDHPFGGSTSNQKGRPTIAPKNAPPGKRVGMIRPRQTGRKKGKTR